MTDESTPRELSAEECERLFAAPSRGQSAVDDLLTAMRVAHDSPVPGAQAALAEFRIHRAARPTRHAAPRKTLVARFSGWTAAAGLSGGLLIAGGGAAAATGHFHDLIDKVGLGSSHPSDPPSHSPRPTPTPAPALVSTTPGAPTPTPTGSFRTSHGKHHGFVGKHHPHPVHPTHPAHPAHPTQAASPSHSAHPTKNAHPTKKSHPTRTAHPNRTPHPSRTSHPTRKAHPAPKTSTHRGQQHS